MCIKHTVTCRSNSQHLRFLSFSEFSFYSIHSPMHTQSTSSSMKRQRRPDRVRLDRLDITWGLLDLKSVDRAAIQWMEVATLKILPRIINWGQKPHWARPHRNQISRVLSFFFLHFCAINGHCYLSLDPPLVSIKYNNIVKKTNKTFILIFKTRMNGLRKTVE